MTVVTVRQGEPLWEPVAAYADGCPWFGGPLFAKELRERTFLDWERLFVALDGDTVAGYCALTAQDGYPELPYTPYINSLFVGVPYRGNRLGGTLLASAEAYAKTCGFTRVYLMTEHKGLYEKYGYTKFCSHPCPWDGTKREDFFFKDL